MTVVTVAAARTLGDLKARIADELARTDLTSQIALAITDAIDIAAAHRFWFSEVRGLEILLTAGQAYYTNADIQALVEVDNLYLWLNGNQRRNLLVAPNARLDALYNGTLPSGSPLRWSRYENELRFWPTPDQAYTVYLDGSTKGQPMQNDTDSAVWTTYAERYVRALAKLQLYAEVIRDEDQALAQSKLAESYLENLQSASESRVMTGEMEAFGV